MAPKKFKASLLIKAVSLNKHLGDIFPPFARCIFFEKKIFILLNKKNIKKKPKIDQKFNIFFLIKFL